MFSTGFLCDKDAACRLAEPMDGTTMEMVRKWSRQYDAAICGSFIARDNDRIFNRAFFITPSGEETFYDKHHLFTMSGEDSVYTRGSSAMPVVTFRGWNVAFAVCFDLRFRCGSATGAKPTTSLIVMANWPDSRAYAWGAAAHSKGHRKSSLCHRMQPLGFRQIRSLLRHISHNRTERP